MNRFGTVITMITVLALCAPVRADQATRVKNLYVEDEARQYFDIVAFAPGSGWVKINSSEVMRPLLNLNNVTASDLKRFNRYVQSCGLPVRAEFLGGILHLVMRGTSVSFLTRLNRIKPNLHWEPEEKFRLAIIKDKSGKTFLVKRATVVRTAQRPDNKKSIRKKSTISRPPRS
ncbi:hypothetical protein D1AOALGA4SA_5372 [Olavius algarvensis Delta 1 endosymbiont]|nr:hypothetical protein D1AOALGA4SA_5372 [Olavius algarvensis Delta 1 endosymbiont]